MAKDLVSPSRYGAAGTINGYTLDGGFTPANTHFHLTVPATTYSPSTDRLHFYVKALETKAPAATGGQPRQYALVACSCFRLDSGQITDDTLNIDGDATDDAFNDIVQGAVICDGPANGSPTSATLGTTILLVTFGTGNPNPNATSETGCYYRALNSDTAGSAWSEATAGDTSHLTAWQIIKAGPDLYAATDAGRCGSLGEYRVSKCPAGSNPLLAASWGNGVEVGTPEWIITGMAAIGDAPVVGKPDGLYFYNGQTRRYENVMKHFELTPHALNGKVTEAVTDGVVYTTFDGGAYIFDGVSTQEISPAKLWKMLGKDVPAARITAVADRGDAIAMATEAGYQTTQNANLVVNRVDMSAGNSTATAMPETADGSLATGGSLNSLAVDEHIDVWADIPFEGVIFHVTRAPNSTTTAVIGTVSYSSATDTFTAYSGFRDGTRLIGNLTTATAGGSFSYVAFPPSASSGLVVPTDVNAGALMQRVNYNYNTGTDVTNKYGMRFTISGAALDSATEIDEVEIIPFRPGLPNETILTATTNYTPRFRSGCLQNIYLIKRKGTNSFVPHDSFAIDNGGAVWAMAYHAGRPGQASGAQNTGQSLVLWGRYKTTMINEGPTRNPAKDLFPITVQHSTTKPGPVWQFLYDWDGGDRTRKKVITDVFIDTLFLEPSDTWEVFFQHDQKDIVKVHSGEGGPVAFKPPQTEVRLMQAWLVLKRGQVTNERAPQFLEPIKVLFDWKDDIAEGQDVARPTPLLT